MGWAMLVVFVPATTNSYEHCREMCGYTTTTQGDVRVSTSQHTGKEMCR